MPDRSGQQIARGVDRLLFPRFQREVEVGKSPANRRIQDGRQYVVDIRLIAAQRFAHLLIAVGLVAKPVANEGT